MIAFGIIVNIVIFRTCKKILYSSIGLKLVLNYNFESTYKVEFRKIIIIFENIRVQESMQTVWECI